MPRLLLAEAQRPVHCLSLKCPCRVAATEYRLCMVLAWPSSSPLPSALHAHACAVQRRLDHTCGSACQPHLTVFETPAI